MIKTLSPHYKTIPWLSPSSATTPDKYVLNIYVWDGLKASVPASPSYEIENLNPLERTGDTKVDISNYINDFLNVSRVTNTTTNTKDADSAVWVRTEVIYHIGGVAQSAEFIETDLTIRGYGYGLEGENPGIPTNDVLSHGVDPYVGTDSIYLFYYMASETVSTNISLVSENRTVNITRTATTDSSELIQQVWIDLSEFPNDTYIEISKDTVLITTLLIRQEYRYTPIDIVFTNKEGQLQSITFFKEKTTSLDTDRKEYESSSGQPSDGVHQFKNYNVNGREDFKVNSGFISEDNNEVFTQLMLSEVIYQLENNNYIPLNIKTSNIEYKSRQKDRIIDYAIEFKYGFKKKNNI